MNPEQLTESQKNEAYETKIEKIYDRLFEQLDPITPHEIIHGIAVQIYTAEEARERINAEGSVVRDIKGSVVPHPAIKIEQDSIKIYTGLIAKHKKIVAKPKIR